MTPDFARWNGWRPRERRCRLCVSSLFMLPWSAGSCTTIRGRSQGDGRKSRRLGAALSRDAVRMDDERRSDGSVRRAGARLSEREPAARLDGHVQPPGIAAPSSHRTAAAPCHEQHFDLVPPRHARLRPYSARPEMAGRCPHRAPVRHQLRGGRRELRAARRRGVGGVSLRDRRGAAAPRRASHEHGVDLRVRLAGGILAALAAVHAPGDTDHRLRGGDGARTQPRGGGGDAGGGLGDREPRPALDRLPVRAARRGARALRAGHGDPHPGDRGPAARVVHGTDQPEHAGSRQGRRRISLRLRFLRRRPAVLGGRPRTGRIW